MYAKLLSNHISDSDRTYFESLNEGWSVPSRDCIQIKWNEKETTTYVIFCGPFTKNEMCRDCCDHFELSTGGKTYIIEKRSLKIERVRS